MCPQADNEVDSKLSNEVLATLITELCPADTNTKNKGLLTKSFIFWRRHPDLNRGIRVLQTRALPLGYSAIFYCIKKNGADDEARTRYLHLGKVALYQMSYIRNWCLRSESNQRHVDFQSTALPTELQRQTAKKSGDPERARTVDL